MAKTGKQMLEKRPGETDADHLADPACRALIKALIGLRANRGCGQPPDEADHGSRGQCRAGRAVEDRYKHVYAPRSEEHTSELQSLMRISYAVFCLKKKKQKQR